MNDRQNHLELRLDPYTSSSLLQKAIRRGHVDYATDALAAYFRYRGKGIWRRLVTIAIEDIGVANVPLVLEVLRSAADYDVREQVAPAQALAARMALSTKSRSADYLYSCVARCLAGHTGTASSLAEFIDIAADPSRSLILRSAALLTPAAGRLSITGREAACRLDHLTAFLPPSAADLVAPTVAAYRIVKHPFVLLLPLIAASIAESGAGVRPAEEAMPPWADLNGVPSYVFDKHTSRGKRAAALLAELNDDVATALSAHVLPGSHHAVAQMAAFYADAVPVNRNLLWMGSTELEAAGTEADMLAVGCPPSGMRPILAAVARNLAHLDELRGSLIMGRTGT